MLLKKCCNKKLLLPVWPNLPAGGSGNATAANWSTGRRDKSEGTLARELPPGVFFWQQRGREIAGLFLSLKTYWRRPSWALLGVGKGIIEKGT